MDDKVKTLFNRLRSKNKDVKLSSESGAPLPNYSNTSGKIPERQNALQALGDLYNKRVNELNESYSKGMQEDFGLTDEEAKDAFIKVDPLAIAGSITKVGNLGRTPKALKVAEDITDPFSPNRRPVTEIGKGIDDKTRRINSLIQSERRVPKKAPDPRPIEKLPESTYSKIPVAEEEAILKRLTDSLLKK